MKLFEIKEDFDILVSFKKIKFNKISNNIIIQS